MPIYIRKNVSFTPPSINRMSDDDDDDYLQDPDQLRDVLPQPYRMINKVLDQLLSDVWETIEDKEIRRIKEEQKVKPLKCDKPIMLKDFRSATALCSSPDGAFIFLGLPNGLAAIYAMSQEILSVWEEENTEICSIHSQVISLSAYLLDTIDDMGVARIFLFAYDSLFFVRTLNESDGSKLLATFCKASRSGDFVGIVLENPSTKEVLFETHKLPREAWLKELDIIGETLMLKYKDSREMVAESLSPTDAFPVDHSSDDGKKIQAKKKRSRNDRSESPHPTRPKDSIAGYKFSTTTLVLRVRQPGPLTANSSNSVYMACQKVDTGEVLGTGQTHILSSTWLETYDTNFQNLHENAKKYLKQEEGKKKDNVVTATFHFLNPGRSLPQGLESGNSDRATGVALWWKDTCHLLQFSLLKVAKDVEHKPDVVWPFSCNISASASNLGSTHLAVGLENGNIVIWDRYLGLQRGVINMNKNIPVQIIRFLKTPLYSPPPSETYTYLQYSCNFILAQFKDSKQFLYDVDRIIQTKPLCIGEIAEEDDEIQTLLQSVPSIPQLALMVQKNGTLYLKDIQRGTKVCQLTLPETHQLASPWDPIVAFGGQGQLLFVKGNGSETNENGESIDTSGIFVFNLNSYSSLNKYWARVSAIPSFIVHATVEKRVDNLLKERMKQQPQRKQRLQQRWGMLRSDLDTIQKAREVTIEPNGHTFKI